MLFLRRAISALAIGFTMAVPACAAHAATFVVDRADDADVSACSTAANDCSLRGAINKANAATGADTITFAAGVRGTIVLNGTQLPIVTGNLTIQGPGASALSVDGDRKSRILANAAGNSLTLSGLALIQGRSELNPAGSNNPNGAAIDNAGTLALTQCLFDRNANFFAGGAIYNTGALTIDRSTFSGNSCYRDGGAIFSSGTLSISDSTLNNNSAAITNGGGLYNSGTATIVRSTVSGNSANGQFSGSSSTTSALGGGIFNNGNLTLRNSTISGNSITSRPNGTFCGGGICSQTGTLVLESCTVTQNTAQAGKGSGLLIGGDVTIANSIIAGNNGSDIDFSPTSGTALTDGDTVLVGNGTAASSFASPGDQRGVDPKLGPLADNGGPTFTHAPLAGSTAIDRGNTDLTIDQRGAMRPAGNADDIGAYELQTNDGTPETPSLRVTTLSDVTANDGQTSLREAILFANSKTGADTITFADNVRGKITLGARLPNATDALTIQGPGAPNLSVDGGGKFRLLRVAKGATVSINDLTLAGGFYNASAGPEGGIYNEGDLTLRQVFMTGNTGIEGGAITNNKGSVTILGSLLSGNTAVNAGGGLLNNDGNVVVINSTISNNVATGSQNSGAGGVSTFGDNARVRLECVTLSGNSAPNVAGNTRAGVWIENGALVLHNSILTGNGARDLQQDGGSVSSEGYNIIGSFGSFNSTPNFSGSDRFGIDPKLGALADNGGPTFTYALLPGSPAINSGDPKITEGFDQRGGGFPRVRGGRIDVGAFEVQSDAGTVSVALSPRDPKTDSVLTATISGFADASLVSYVWKRNGQIIPNETKSTLDLRTVGRGDKGDVVSVEATSGSGFASDSVTVVNSAPFAVTVRGSVEADTEIRLPLRAFDADGERISFRIVSGPNNGTATIEPQSSGVATLVYRSRPRYNGVEVIRFVAVDSEGLESAPSSAGIAVQYTAPPVNRAPVAGDTFIDTFVGDSVVKGLLGRDPDGDPITFRIVNNAKFGRSEIKRDTDGQFKLFYTSLNRFYGPDRVTYIAIDDKGKESNIATIGINFVNRSPVAQNNELQVASGELVSQYLFALDPDNDAITFRLVNNPQHGTGSVRLDEQGNWRVYYQSVPGYVGTDRITFIAIDPFGKESQVATANINVVNVPSAPSALQAAPAKAPSGGGS